MVYSQSRACALYMGATIGQIIGDICKSFSCKRFLKATKQISNNKEIPQVEAEIC